MKKIKTIKKHVVRNRGWYAAMGTATAFLVLMSRNAKALEGFMKDHDLSDEYHAWLKEQK